jgi:hypothetical protein
MLRCLFAERDGSTPVRVTDTGPWVQSLPDLISWSLFVCACSVVRSFTMETYKIMRCLCLVFQTDIGVSCIQAWHARARAHTHTHTHKVIGIFYKLVFAILLYPLFFVVIYLTYKSIVNNVNQQYRYYTTQNLSRCQAPQI